MQFAHLGPHSTDLAPDLVESGPVLDSIIVNVPDFGTGWGRFVSVCLGVFPLWGAARGLLDRSSMNGGSLWPLEV